MSFDFYTLLCLKAFFPIVLRIKFLVRLHLHCKKEDTLRYTKKDNKFNKKDK